MKGSTERRTQRRGDRITLAILVGVAAGILFMAGFGTILYRRGIRAGRDEIRTASREAVEEITNVVEEKDELAKKLQELAEITETQAYREKLEEISAETKDEPIKNILLTLAGEVRAYAEVEGAEDKVASEYELTQLREKVQTTERSIQGRFKERLENAVAKLN